MNCFLVLILYSVHVARGSVNQAAFADGLNNNLNDALTCDRDCDGTPMECYYSLDIESYSTMSKACYHCPSVLSDCYRPHCVPGNGHKRLVLTANRQMPGPAIRVCHGDTLIVNVSNNMYNSESLSMHWHGIFQHGTPYMDGVGLVSQCPIQPGATWTYRFKAEPAGTHWYHSHTGPQRGDGLYGAIVVKDHAEKNSNQYDHDIPEHSIFLSDFEKTPAVVKAVLHEHSKENNKPEYLLINGQGAEDDLVVAKPNWAKGNWTLRHAPYHRINVEQGSRYRLRLISNALLNCPIEVFIQGHDFTVIASDGAEIDAVNGNLIVVSGGERWDIVINTNKTLANYWFYIRGLKDCAPGGKYIQQLAVLHYVGAADDELPQGETNITSIRETRDDWLIINPLDEGMINPSDNDSLVTLSELSSLESVADWIKEEPDHKFYLGLDLHWVDNDLTNNEQFYSQDSQLELGGRSVIAQINRISGMLADRPYLTQYSEIPEEKFCTYDSSNHNYIKKECEKKGCYCIHRMKVELGDVVELVFIDEGKPFNGSNHPIHIHGQYMAVVAVGQDPSQKLLRSDVIQMDKRNEIKRNFNSPILKDTIMMPDGGYIVSKFKADNPGVWIIHCHNEVHATQGMNILLEVGEPDTWPLLNNLPQCGSYHYSDPIRSTHSNSANQNLCYSFYTVFLNLLTVFIIYICN